MVQKVLEEEVWMKRLTKEDYRGLTPLFYGHVEPYGTLRLDMDQRITLDTATHLKGWKDDHKPDTAEEKGERTGEVAQDRAA